MRVTAVILGLVVVAASSRLPAATVFDLIRAGKLDQARDSLSARATASSRDGNTLFLQSLLEPEADRAAQMMNAALSAAVNTEYQEDIYLRLAQYYLMQRNYVELSRVLTDYRARWEDGRYRAEMARLSILLDELSGDGESALNQCDRYLTRYGSGDRAQWGQIDKARLLAAGGKGVGAQTMLKQLSRRKKGAGIALSLYLLGVRAVEAKRIDDGVFYYNLLREAYPAAVGIDDVVDLLGAVSVGRKTSNQAEKLTGTFYSVKVGVFSKASNAKRQAAKFKPYDRKIEIKKKNISGETYRVVYVGRFEDYYEAVRFKVQLEATHREAFQVVTR